MTLGAKYKMVKYIVSYVSAETKMPNLQPYKL